MKYFTSFRIHGTQFFAMILIECVIRHTSLPRNQSELRPSFRHQRKSFNILSYCPPMMRFNEKGKISGKEKEMDEGSLTQGGENSGPP